jgi:cation diffusion facilitator CzcD-associated flavoprotein CzcO
MKHYDVAVIGAGPYGLSLGAQLSAQGVDHCVFGPAMAFWRDNMPPGTKLKSDGQSSDLPAPNGGYTISAFQTARDGSFEITRPIPVETFHDYGLAFRERLVAAADPRRVRDLRRTESGFTLTMDDGEAITARIAVLAIGVESFPYIPPRLASLPAGRVSHSVTYGPVAALAGKRVAVIGAGASAIDVAAALHEAGADTEIITRRSGIAFHHPPGKRKLRHRIRRPDTGIGGGWDLWIYANAPILFHILPAKTRRRIVETTLGAAPGWFMRPRIEGKVTIRAGMTTKTIAAEPDGIVFTLQDQAGATHRLAFDHVVAATGFRPDVARIACLDRNLVAAIRTEGTAPALSRHFETSVPGLYMIGPVAAHSFGPVMRFVFGAATTTPRLARHIARRLGRPTVAVPRPAAPAVACVNPGE